MKIASYGFNENAKEENRRIFDTDAKIDEFLKIKYGGGYCFGVDELSRHGQYKEAAFCYDFRPVLKKFLIGENGHYYHGYAPNKMALRRIMHLPRNATVMNFPKN